MALPVDIPAVLKAATDATDKANEPVSVSVWIDDTAAADCIAQVRGAFASPEGTNARVSLSYMDNGVQPRSEDDLAVIVAGSDAGVGRAAADIRAAGVPVMVATTSPDAVREHADASGFPIPDGDVIAPVRTPGAFPRAKAPALPAAEPIALTEQAKSLLNERMGSWAVAAAPEKRLALAHAFPFVRRPLAMDAINSTALQNAGIGLLPIIPGADMPIMTLNQAKMLMQIATAYGQPLDKERIPELVALIGNAFLCRMVARSLAKAVPVAGLVISGGIGFAATEAVGRAAIEYFEAGGSAAGLANVAKTAATEAADAAHRAGATPLGQRAIKAAKGAARGAVGLLRPKRG